MEFRSASGSWTGFTPETGSGGGGGTGRLPPPFLFFAALDRLLGFGFGFGFGLGLGLGAGAGAGAGVAGLSIFAARRDESIVIAASIGQTVPSVVVSHVLHVTTSGKVGV